MHGQRAASRPNWKALIAQHGIALEQLACTVCKLSTLSYEEALQMVTLARGTPAQIDICLLALSRLARVVYSRRNVGGFTFLAPEGDSQVELYLPIDTLEHYLNGMRTHGALVQDTVYPPPQSSVSGRPAPYLVVSLPLGTLLAFEGPEASSVINPNDLMAYFPDGFVLQTRLARAWGIAYHVVISQQDGAVSPLRETESSPDPTT